MFDLGGHYLQLSRTHFYQVAQMVKKSTCHCRPRFKPWVRKTPWRREWLPTRVFLHGEFQGQRSLVGYSPWGHKESDMTEVTEHACTCFWICTYMFFISLESFSQHLFKYHLFYILFVRDSDSHTLILPTSSSNPLVLLSPLPHKCCSVFRSE